MNTTDKITKCEKKIKDVNAKIGKLNTQISRLRSDPNKSQQLGRLEKRRNNKFNRKDSLESSLSKLLRKRREINDKLQREGR